MLRCVLVFALVPMTGCITALATTLLADEESSCASGEAWVRPGEDTPYDDEATCEEGVEVECVCAAIPTAPAPTT